ncbi:MAG: hypothetical protein RSC27_03335 [Bacilli bacterium]
MPIIVVSSKPSVLDELLKITEGLSSRLVSKSSTFTRIIFFIMPKFLSSSSRA